MRFFPGICGMILMGYVSGAGAEMHPVAPYSGWPMRDVADSHIVRETVTPELIWSLVCDGDSEPIVGHLIAAAPGKNNSILLVDSQMAHVLVVGPDGAINRVVGMRGSGPGEITGSFRTLQLADGRIGIADGIDSPGVKVGARGNLVLYDGESQPGGELNLGGDPGSIPVCSVRDLRYSGAKILAVTFRNAVQPPNMVSILELSLYDPIDNGREVIARNLSSSDMRDPAARERDCVEVFAGGRCDIDARGRLAWVVERDRWAVAVRQPDGTGCVFRRDEPPVRRSDETMRRVREALGGGDDSQVFSDEPVIKGVRWRPDGNLWVELFQEEQNPESIACFDEISPDGELVRRMRISIPGVTGTSRLEVLEDGRLVLFRGFDRRRTDGSTNEQPSVSLFRMASPAK